MIVREHLIARLSQHDISFFFASSYNYNYRHLIIAYTFVLTKTP